MKRFLKSTTIWTPVWMITLLVFIMTLIYVPTFTSMMTNMEELPVLIINEDQGAELQDQKVNFGNNIETALIESAESNTLEWQNIASRDEAMELLNTGKDVAAVVIPADYSESLQTLKTGLVSNLSGLEAVSFEVIINEASGQSATGVTTQAVTGVVNSISNSLTAEIAKALSTGENQLSAENALLLAQPIATTKTTAAEPLIDSGMSSFIIGMVLVISGMLGSSLIKSYINGVEKELQPLNQKRQHYAGMHAEIVLGFCLSVSVSILVMMAVFGIYGMPHTANLFSIFLFMILSLMTMFMLYTTVSIFLGLKWSLLINFPLNIMGIMASGGSISLYGLPSVVHFFSSFLPSRYVMDGLRSLVYYNGRMESGLEKSLLVLSIYLVVTIICCYWIYYSRRPKIKD